MKQRDEGRAAGGQMVTGLRFHPLIEQAECLVLDIGQVLLQFEPPRLASALLPEGERENALRHVFGGLEWVKLDRGVMNNQEAARSICARPPMQGKDALVLDLLRAFPDQMHPLPLSGHLAAFKARGKRLFALSNFHAEAYARIRGLHPFFDLMEGLLISAHERLLKPEPAIYQRLFERFGLTPAQCVFIDDTAANVAAGRLAGMPGIVYEWLHSVTTGSDPAL